MPHTHTFRAQPLALIADDDETVRTLTRVALEQSGLAVEAAADGQEALELFKRMSPDIVLLDVMMPRMDGFEACHAIRHCPGGSHTPILIMTGLDDAESIERAYDMGATDFIAKPWQVLVLTNRVRYMLRAGRVVQALRDSQQQLARAQQLARLGSWTWTIATDHLALSDEAYRILGLSLGQFSHTRDAYLTFVHPDDQELVQQSSEEVRYGQRPYSLDYRIVRADGTERIVTEQAEPIVDDSGATAAIAGIIQDITDRRNAEAQVFLSTYYDSVTNLPNRRLFHERLATALEVTAHAGHLGALLLLNLDQFRRINDSYGMTQGDDVLRTVSERIQHSLRKGDAFTHAEPDDPGPAVARLVGDTFAIFLPHLASERDAAKAARRLLSTLHRPLTVGEEQVALSASIGITLFPSEGLTADALVHNAEAALQAAKAKGGNRFEYFVRDMHTGAIDRHALEQDLRRAIDRHELVLHYQPQVDMKRWAITAVEAFVRWHHPTRGVIPPAQFIRMAEEAGLGVLLGEWVIRTACAQQKTWRMSGAPAIRVSVNISDYHVKQHTLAEIVSLAVQDIGPSPDFLELEVTEGAIMHDMAHSAKLLKRLKSLGVRIALDDFGAGSSSLRELTHLPIDSLKIAPVFVQDSNHHGTHGGLTAALIGLGHGLRCRVIAKNVETQEQLEFLRQLGCDEIQGHVYGAAESPERIAQLLLSKPSGLSRRPAA